MNYYFYYYFFIIQELLTGRPQEAEARAPSSSSWSDPGSEGLPAEDQSGFSLVEELQIPAVTCQRSAGGQAARWSAVRGLRLLQLAADVGCLRWEGSLFRRDLPLNIPPPVSHSFFNDAHIRARRCHSLCGGGVCF